MLALHSHRTNPMAKEGTLRPDGFRDRGRQVTRLEAFVDAAFAFAVTLLVISLDSIPDSADALLKALRAVPAFGLSFVLIAMFWFAHNTWSRRYGLDDFGAIVLSLLLVFLVLVYVYPLRMMADAFVVYFSGQPGQLSRADLPGLFTTYGLGFAAMAGLVAALFVTGLRIGTPAAGMRRVLVGELGIWLILTASGMVSVLLAQFDATVPFAPWTYALLPVTIGIFAWRHQWE